jgi:hypothetical protein
MIDYKKDFFDYTKDKEYKEQMEKKVEQSKSAVKIALDFCLSDYPKDIRPDLVLENFVELVGPYEIEIWEPFENKDPEEVAELIQQLASDIEELLKPKDVELTNLRLELRGALLKIALLENKLRRCTK